MSQRTQPQRRGRGCGLTSATWGRSLESGRSMLHDVAAGDPDAISALRHTYEGKIRGLAHRLSVSSASDADDIVQEALTKIWRSAAQFDPARGTEATFIFNIARGVIIDRWRRASRRPNETGREEAMHVIDRAAGDAYNTALVSSVVNDAIDTLTAQQREVIELAYRHDLSQAEIAAKLDVPLGTVKTRTFAALKTLRRTLIASEVLA